MWAPISELTRLRARLHILEQKVEALAVDLTQLTAAVTRVAADMTALIQKYELVVGADQVSATAQASVDALTASLNTAASAAEAALAGTGSTGPAAPAPAAPAPSASGATGA